MKPACVVLAGGLGTRLRPAVSNLPKVLAPVGGRPFLAYILSQIKSAGITDVVLCVGYKKKLVEAWCGDGKRFGLSIRYSRETRLLGTAGALGKAAGLVHSDVCVVMNGDSFCDVDIASLVRYHRRKHASATLVSVCLADCSRYGCIDTDDAGRVTAFREKEASRKTGRINSGVYVFTKRFLAALPSGRLSLEKDVFPRVAAHKRLFAFPTGGFFIDIGVPSDYRKAQKLLKIKKSQPVS